MGWELKLAWSTCGVGSESIGNDCGKCRHGRRVLVGRTTCTTHWQAGVVHQTPLAKKTAAHVFNCLPSDSKLELNFSLFCFFSLEALASVGGPGVLGKKVGSVLRIGVYRSTLRVPMMMR